MASILIGGLFFERKVFLANSLAAAAFFILCWNTNELFSTGFQLSFAVVGAIVLFSDPFFRVFQRRSAADPFLPQTLVRGPRRWIHSSDEWVSGGVSVSLAAWIGSLPLILWYFHLVTPISLIANLMVVPIAFFVLAIALVSLLATPLFPWIAVVFNNANWTLATLVIGIVDLFAQIPGGHFYVPPLNWNGKSSARMTVLDLGAGAAVHLRSVGPNWLFDCGSERNYERVVREYLHWAGVNRLSGLFLSHGDSLHIGGAMELLSDVLIKGQHHSAASGSAAFLDAVRPQLIIATSQDFPERERISEDWADRVRARGIKLFRQDETGAVQLEFRGREWTARAYLTGEIFRSVSR